MSGRNCRRWTLLDLPRPGPGAPNLTGVPRGRFKAGVQAGHPLEVYSHAYVGEVALGRILADPGGELLTLPQETRRYPEPLREALIANANAQWEAPFILVSARKGAARGTPSTLPAASSARLARVLMAAMVA